MTPVNSRRDGAYGERRYICTGYSKNDPYEI